MKLVGPETVEVPVRGVTLTMVKDKTTHTLLNAVVASLLALHDPRVDRILQAFDIKLSDDKKTVGPRTGCG